MPIDREFTMEILRELVRIDSRNPGLEPGAPGERPLAERLRDVLADIGWGAELRDADDGRPNVVAVRRGAGGGPSLMINAHMDTVGIAGMAEPLSGELRDGRVYGRGAQDTKGGIAAALGAARALAEDGVGLRGDLVLAFVADEEHESLGTTRLLEHVRTDAAVVLEPSDLDVCVAHRGFGLFALRTRGRAAHGGRPDLGVDANLHMSRLLVEVDRLRARWAAEHRHLVLGVPSLHVPRLRGGSRLYTYADECRADIEVRTVPGQSAATVLAGLRSVAARLGDELAAFEASVDLRLWRAPYEIAPDRPIVDAVLAAAEAVRLDAPRLVGHGWWEDSGLLGEAGIETVVIGPRGDGLHTAEEWVDVESVVELAEILRRSAVSYCGASE